MRYLAIIFFLFSLNSEGQFLFKSICIIGDFKNLSSGMMFIGKPFIMDKFDSVKIENGKAFFIPKDIKEESWIELSFGTNKKYNNRNVLVNEGDTIKITADFDTTLSIAQHENSVKIIGGKFNEYLEKLLTDNQVVNQNLSKNWNNNDANAKILNDCLEKNKKTILNSESYICRAFSFNFLVEKNKNLPFIDWQLLDQLAQYLQIESNKSTFLAIQIREYWNFRKK